MNLVSIKFNKGKRSYIRGFVGTIGLQYFEIELQRTSLSCFISKTIKAALCSNIIGKGVKAISPPKPSAFILIKAQNLLGKSLPRFRHDCKIAIQNIIHFRAIFQKEPMANTLIAHIVVNIKIIGSMNGYPTIMAIPDGVSFDKSTTHGLACKMKMNAVTTKGIFLTQVSEFGIGKRTC